ncbi:DUF3040 domain-containing protein [Nocardioides sp.]|uniref:DUF3040 domain-containing protein n=1 Tax=Nocardioides sp. TaxID=35761 RepID=UPI0035664001
MPLSEEELRLLEQMERALVEEDPKLASALRGTTMRRSARRRALLAVAAFTVGVVVLMTGAITEWWFVGILGFVIMLASATIGVSSLRTQRVSPASDPRTADHPSHGFTLIEGGKSGRGRRQRRQSSDTSFMERLEERWRHRREGNGGF